MIKNLVPLYKNSSHLKLKNCQTIHLKLHFNQWLHKKMTDDLKMSLNFSSIRLLKGLSVILKSFHSLGLQILSRASPMVRQSLKLYKVKHLPLFRKNKFKYVSILMISPSIYRKWLENRWLGQWWLLYKASC